MSGPRSTVTPVVLQPGFGGGEIGGFDGEAEVIEAGRGAGEGWVGDEVDEGRANAGGDEGAPAGREIGFALDGEAQEIAIEGQAAAEVAHAQD